MPVFAYRGRSGAGIVAGEIEANDRPAAVAQLRTKGVIALSVQERQAKVAAVKKIGGSVKDKDLAIYTRQFSTDRKSTRLNSSHSQISYAVFCLKKKKNVEYAMQIHTRIHVVAESDMLS